MSEYGVLGRLVHDQGQGWRLRKGQRDGLYVITDETNAILTEDDLTPAEVRGLCSGRIGLAQLRQPAKAD